MKRGIPFHPVCNYHAMPWPPGLGVIITDYPPFVIRELVVVIIVFTAYFSSFVFVFLGVLGIGGGALGFFEGALVFVRGALPIFTGALD